MSEPRWGPDERLAVLESQVRTLSSYLRRSSARAARADQARLDARLAPSLLPPADTLRGELSAAPDLGTPLMDRLRADSALSHSVAGSSLAALSSGNLLADPTFDTLKTNLAISTSWQSLGPDWEIRYVLDSGLAPPTMYLAWQPARDFYSSAQVHLVAQWSNAGDVGQVTVQLRTTGDNGNVPAINWPHLVAAVRAYHDPDADREGSCLARLSISDGGAVIATSEAADLEALGDAGLEAQPYIVLEDPLVELSTADNPDIQIDVTISSLGSSSLPRWASVYLGEPQLVYADEPSPQMYQPAVGRWNPYPRMIGCYVERTTAQAISDASTETLYYQSDKISTHYDLGEFHNPAGSSDRFVAPITAYYDVTLSGSWESNASGDRRLTMLHSVEGVRRFVRERAASGGLHGQQVHDTVFLESGEYLTFTARQTSGATLDLSTVVDIKLDRLPDYGYE